MRALPSVVIMSFVLGGSAYAQDSGPVNPGSASALTGTASNITITSSTLNNPMIALTRTQISDADYTILAPDHHVVQTGTMTAPRTWTLPLAAAVPEGASIVIEDVSNTTNNTNYINIVRSGTDTISAASSSESSGTSVRLDMIKGRRTLTSDGVSQWSEIKAITLQRLQFPVHTDPKFGVYWGAYGQNYASIALDSTQWKLRLLSKKRIDLLPGQDGLGDGFIQLLNDGFDNNTVFLSAEGTAEAARVNVPSHKLGLGTDWWDGAAAQGRMTWLRANTDAVGASYLSIYPNGDTGTDAYPFSWPPRSAGTEVLRVTTAGAAVISGSAEAPSYAFLSSGSSGWFYTGTAPALSWNGVNIWTPTDPGADAVMGWDDSEGRYDYLTAAETRSAISAAVSGSNADITHAKGFAQASAAPSVASASNPTSGLGFFGSDVQIVRSATTLLSTANGGISIFGSFSAPVEAGGANSITINTAGNIVSEGATADTFEGVFSFPNWSADQAIAWRDASGTVAVDASQAVALSADDQAVTVTGNILLITSDDATPANRTFTLVAGYAGQAATLYWNDTDGGELVDSGAAQLGAAWTPGQHDTLTLIYNGTVWVECSRADN